MSDWPSREAVWSSQHDLRLLCRDRPLVTNEPFEANAYYGIAHVLRQYAGLGQRETIKAVVPHAPFLDPTFLWDQEARASVPAILAYPDYRLPTYRRNRRHIVIPSASPFLYVTRQLRSSRAETARGTIFFAAHSTHHVTTDENTSVTLAALERLPADKRPISVMVYWRDVHLGRHVPYAQAGYPIISAGHMYDPTFFVRLYYLCARHKFATSAVVGSHVFYSTAAGCRFFFLETPWANQESFPNERILRERVAADPGGVTDEFLGQKHLRSPSDLRRLLAALNRLDQTGYVTISRGNRPKIVFSPRFARCAARTLRGIGPRSS